MDPILLTRCFAYYEIVHVQAGVRHEILSRNYFLNSLHNIETKWGGPHFVNQMFCLFCQHVGKNVNTNQSIIVL